MRRFADLPVSVDLDGALGREVTAFVESEAGWQVVGAAGPLVPAFRLTDRPTGRPCVIVRQAPVSPDEVRDALLAGAVDVICWPDERARLLDVPLRVRRDAPTGPTPPVLGVGGSRGGVGTSTVALTMAASVVWSGGRALVTGGDDLLRLAGRGPWKGPGTLELAALGAEAAAEVDRVAVAVAGVPGLRVLGGAGGIGEPVGWPYDLIVSDVGGAAVAGADVVVAAADASLTAVPADAAVLVVEHGPLDRAGVRARLGRRPTAWLPYSARVARAGSKGRVPSALPGSFVAAVRRGLEGSVR